MGSTPLLPNMTHENGMAANSYDQWYLWSSVRNSKLRDLIVKTYKTKEVSPKSTDFDDLRITSCITMDGILSSSAIQFSLISI